MNDNKNQKYPYGDKWFYAIVKPILVVLVYLLYPPKVKGRENIPKEGPVVLAGNHTKWLDPVTLCAVVKKRQVHFLAKKELFHGFYLLIMKGVGAIPVDRSIHDHGALVYAIQGLKRGLTIGIFPEGTINRTDDVIMPFKMGAVKMAQEANAPIVPFVITGKYQLFRRGETIEFLKPMEVGEQLEEANQKLMDVVSQKLIEGGVKSGKETKTNRL
ncbi:MAG: 1-acyl-sn-glycerol-3-phosphate acyltransferase [Bacilli bacterium]|nr:1-acyl-sn-glycerol-3-phosphate acyltransferase [Bacilli bacterium]